MLTTKPEKSLTREITGKYTISDKVSLKSSAYKSSVSDVLNRSNSSGGYNETIDIKQEGLENTLNFKDENQNLSLTNTLSKSLEGNGRPQLRRPQIQYGANYKAKFKSNYIGQYGLHLNYRHVGQVEDWVGSVRKKVDSTDIINMSLSKELLGMDWILSTTNLTDEYYQKPYGYNQEGREIKLSFRAKY